MHRGKPNWEHLSEELHVLITVEDTQNRAKVKMQRAVEEVNKLLIPTVSLFFCITNRKAHKSKIKLFLIKAIIAFFLTFVGWFSYYNLGMLFKSQP